MGQVYTVAVVALFAFISTPDLLPFIALHGACAALFVEVLLAEL